MNLTTRDCILWSIYSLVAEPNINDVLKWRICIVVGYNFGSTQKTNFPEKHFESSKIPKFG